MFWTMIAGVVGWLGMIYEWLMNRKFRNIEIEKELTLLDIKEKEKRNNCDKEYKEKEKEIYNKVIDSDLRKGMWAKVKEDCQQKLEIELEKINAEREYLIKTQKSKFLWSKIKKDKLKDK